jgi:hypothetical protein
MSYLCHAAQTKRNRLAIQHFRTVFSLILLHHRTVFGDEWWKKKRFVHTSLCLVERLGEMEMETAHSEV